MMFRLLVFLTTFLVTIEAHGYLLDPVARSTAWLVDPSFRECCTYHDHMGMFCGGIETQWKVNGGKCGVCGEAYNAPTKQFERGGAMYTGRIVKTYTRGQQIDVSVVITANHKGYFEFRLCSLDSNPNSEATQACLDAGLLTIVETGSTKFRDVERYGSGPNPVIIRVQLPPNVVCQHCVFQWKYTTGNNWGTDPVTGESGLGLGIENETFMGCADISIVGDGVPNTTPTVAPTNPPTTSRTTSGSRTTTRSTTVATTTSPPTGENAWSPNCVQYQKGDVVIYDGIRYKCIYPHTSFLGAQPGPLTWAWWERVN